MKKTLFGLLAVCSVFASVAWAQTDYPTEVLERYWECQERNDLAQIQELTWYHNNVEKIDASIYGLPKDDFDDQALLTINERLSFRELKRQLGVRLATSGSLQYPHHLREALDHNYQVTGERVDCSLILSDAAIEVPEPEALGPGWAADRNLTTSDTNDRGEVDIVIDYANPARILASSCPGQGTVDPTSNFITYTADYGQTWTRTSVGNNSGSAWECDPVSYYQRSTGRVYHSKIGCDTGSCGATMAMMRYSANNGSSWTDCARLGVDNSEDRQWHVVDNTAQYDSNGDGTVDTANACYGNIYATWHNLNQEKVVRSTSNCSTWVNRTNLTTTYSAITPDINVGPDGHVYVVWQNYGDATFKIAGSADCGANWNAPSAKTLKARLGDWKNNIPAQCVRGISTIAHVDVDRCPWSDFYGRVYVTMLDFDQAGCGTGPGCTTWNSACDYDMYIMYSDNQGTSWSAPVDFTRDILNHGDKVDSFMGYMRVDEKDGSIYAAYHRTRLNPTALADRQKTQYFVARSTDGGSTWAELQVSTLEGDERAVGMSTFERGDYNRLDVYNGVIYPVWIDRRNTSGEEEIVTRKICTEPSHRSERSPTFTAPPTTLANAGGGLVNISWTAPDAYWGDGDEAPASRKYQLWFDGALRTDNIVWTTTSISNFDPGDCNAHTYRIRAVNSCAIAKDYQTTTFSATGCCSGNPTTVNVTPNGPLTLCQGTSQLLTLSLTGGTAPFVYQWYRDGVAIGGATGTTYTANDTGTHAYNCEVKGTGCTSGTQDNTATSITWQYAPTFAGLQSVTNPQNATCTLNLSWNVASSVCGGPFSYSVYRSTTSGFTPGAGNRIASGLSCGSSPCPYSDSNALVSGTTYYYVVRATDQSNGQEEANLVERSGAPTGPSTTWTDTVESYANIAAAVTAGYSHAAAQGSDDWAVASGVDHTTGTGKSFTSVDVAVVTDKWLATPAQTLGSTSTMTFWHRYQFETNWDGAVLELSTDGGSTWPVDLGTYITAGGYTGTIGSGYSNPLTGRSAWTGTVSSFTSVTVNLGSFAGTNRKIRWRMGCDSSTAGGTWYIDDIQILTAGSCTTGGGCTNPGAPVITGITDESACAQSGIHLTYTAGSGATSHDLYRDGAQVVVGYVSGALYNPGDTASHSYVVRARVSTCFTDSSPSSFGDASAAPGAPVITGIADEAACAQSGIRVTYTAGSGATSHNLVRDGVVVVTGYVSGTLYNPGNTTSHTYVVRAVSGSCSTDSASQAFTDANATPGAPTITGISDASACAQSGITVSYTGGSGATSHNLVRDGAVVVTAYVSGALYNPGDSASHSYVVRAVNGTCTADSGAQAFADANGTPGAPTITGITDASACAQNGIQVAYTAGSGASSHNLVRDGAVVVTGYVSGALYNPGDGASHTYMVRAVSGTCTTDSAGQAFTDANTSPGAPVIISVVDTDNCAQSGIQVNYTAGAGASSHNLVRDGVVVVSGYASGTVYNPGDAMSHSYVVRAINGSCSTDSSAQGFVDGSDCLCTTPPTFGGLTSVTPITGSSDCGLRLAWSTGTSNCGGVPVYNVYRSTVSGFTPGTANLAAACVAATGFDDTGVVLGTTYYYVVRAEDPTVGNGGPCNTGNQDGNLTQGSGVVSTSVENATQPPPPLTASSGSATSDLTPAFTLEAASLATVGFSLGHSGPGTSETLTAANFTAAAGTTTTQNLNPASTTPAGSASSASFTYTVNRANRVSAATLRCVTTGNTTALTLPTTNNVAVVTDVATFYNANGAGTYQLSITTTTQAVNVSAVSMTVDSSAAGDVTGATQVELLDPAGTPTLLKAYGSAVVSPYTVTAAFTQPGTYRLRVSENTGGTATLTAGTMSVTGTACTTAAVEPLQFLTARATGGQTLLEWQAPDAGTCSSVRIVRKTGSYSTGPTDGTLVGGTEVACGGLGTRGQAPDTGLVNGTTYFYAGYVNNGSGDYSAVRQVKSRPQDVTGSVKWVFSTGASALTPPGIGSVYGVANDRALHSMVPGASGGAWPAGWMPLAMNAPAQARPPVVNFAGGTGPSGASKATFVGSQDGRVYAVDAVTGNQLWMSTDLGLVQASPAGIFDHYGSTYDLILVGTRNSGVDNVFYGIPVNDPTPADDNAPVCSYNGSGGNRIGIISGKATVDYATSRVYFASRARSTGAGTLWCLQISGTAAAPSLGLCSGSWPVALGDIDGSPILRNGTLYVGTNASQVYAVNATTGALTWGAPYSCADGPVKGYVWTDIHSSNLYVATSTKVSSLADGGSTVTFNWSRALSAPSVPLLMLGTNYLLVGSSDGKLHQLNATTGTPSTPLTLGDGSAAIGSPALEVSSGLAYVGSESGAVYAVSVPLP